MYGESAWEKMVMNDSECERYIKLADVPLLPWMPKKSLATVHRWVQSGIGTVKLRTVRVGRTLCTSESWLREFFERLNDPQTEDAPTYRTPARRERDIARADAALVADGF